MSRVERMLFKQLFNKNATYNTHIHITYMNMLTQLNFECSAHSI